MRAILVAALVFAPVLLAKVSEPVQRLDEAATLFSEAMAAPDNGIPQDLLKRITNRRRSARTWRRVRKE